MSTEDDDAFEEHEPPRRGIHASIAVLEAKVRMLTYLFKNDLVSKQEFSPVKLLVYGITGLVLSSVVAALIAFIIRTQT